MVDQKIGVESFSPVLLRVSATFHFVPETAAYFVSFQEVQGLLGYRGTAEPLDSPHRTADLLAKVDLDQLPEHIDWRQKGIITAVKDQGITMENRAFRLVGYVYAAYFVFLDICLWKLMGSTEALSRRNVRIMLVLWLR